MHEHCLFNQIQNTRYFLCIPQHIHRDTPQTMSAKPRTNMNNVARLTWNSIDTAQAEGNAIGIRPETKGVKLYRGTIGNVEADIKLEAALLLHKLHNGHLGLGNHLARTGSKQGGAIATAQMI